jgi:hypothetical protein
VSKKATVNSEAHRLRQQMLSHQFEATHQKRISLIIKHTPFAVTKVEASVLHNAPKEHTLLKHRLCIVQV